MNERKNVALLVSHLDNEFSKEIMFGAGRAATDYDVNLVIFPARFLDSSTHNNYDTFGYQHNTLLRYAEGKSFDLIVVEAGTIGTFLTNNEMAEVLSSYKNTKVITIAKQIPGYHCVRFNTKGFYDAVEHLVVKHGCKNIGFVGGPSTSDDAIERLEVYREVLKQNHLPWNDNFVVEGDFSGYSYKNTSILLTQVAEQNERLDAIVFANDRMAISSYQVIEEMGYRIGEDLLLVGFDDIPTAGVCAPPLSTVKADSRKLGYRSIEEGLMLLDDDRIMLGTVDTAFIPRASCKCGLEIDAKAIDDAFTSKDNAEFLDYVYQIYFASHQESRENQYLTAEVFAYLRKLLSVCEGPDIDLGDAKAILSTDFEHLLNIGLMSIISMDQLNQIVNLLILRAELITKDANRLTGIQQILFSQCKQLVVHNFNANFKDEDHRKRSMRSMTNLMNELLLSNFEVTRCQASIEKCLDKMGVTLCYLYVHNQKCELTEYSQFRLPHSHDLLIGRNDEGIIALEQDNQMVNTSFLFHNKFMPERRFSLVVGPLFLAEEHYGIIACEMKNEEFYFFNLAIRPQFSYAEKLRQMRNQQMEMIDLLKNSLGEAQLDNLRLKEMTKEDALTGENNLRGMYEEFGKLCEAEENRGKEAIMIFADLNNLKMINDSYGHDDGNYAICQIVKALRKILPEKAVISRIGGDEITAFTLGRRNQETRFREEMKNYLAKENLLNDKPYWIEASIGYYEFVVNSNLDCGDVVNEADILMYTDKTSKRKDVSK